MKRVPATLSAALIFRPNRNAESRTDDARPTYGWLPRKARRRGARTPTRRWIVDPLERHPPTFCTGLPAIGAVFHRARDKAQIVLALYRPRQG